MKKIYVLNGPNLNLLGKREPEIYGHITLQDIHDRLEKLAKPYKIDISFHQSNSEGKLIDLIHEAGQHPDSAIILNAGAFTHSSIALLDALLSVNIPSVEVHLSNIFKREEFRHHSYISQGVIGMICGFGPKSYELAFQYLAGQPGGEK